MICHRKPPEVRETVLQGDLGDGVPLAICGLQFTVGRIQARGLEVIRDAEVEVLPEAAFRPGAAKANSAQVNAGNSCVIARLINLVLIAAIAPSPEFVTCWLILYRTDCLEY